MDQALSKKERQEIKKEEKLNRQMSEQKKKKLTSALLWSFVTIFVCGTIGLMIYAASKNSGPQFVAGSAPEATESDWHKGAPLTDKNSQGSDAKSVTLIEYSDFQCPACSVYYPILKQLEKDFPNLTLVYRHFPLVQHKNAQAAAQAAEAAGVQGKFWEMHDMLFEKQAAWSDSSDAPDIFAGFAKNLGLDINKYQKDFASSEINNKILTQMESIRKEISGTPTFFINSQKIENPRNYDEFRNTIQRASAKQS